MALKGKRSIWKLNSNAFFQLSLPRDSGKSTDFVVNSVLNELLSSYQNVPALRIAVHWEALQTFEV